jgi:hypothetical protein
VALTATPSMLMALHMLAPAPSILMSVYPVLKKFNPLLTWF